MKWTENCHWLESKIWSKSLEDVLRASKELTEVMESLKESWGGWGNGGLLHRLTNKEFNHSDNNVQIHNKVKANTYILLSPHNGECWVLLEGEGRKTAAILLYSQMEEKYNGIRGCDFWWVCRSKISSWSPTQTNQPLQNPAMPPSDLFYDLNQFDSTGD